MSMFRYLAVQIKQMKLLFSALLFLSVLSAYAQKHAAFEALAKSDIASLSALFDSRLELCYDEKMTILKKQDAAQSLSSFLQNNPPKTVTPVHSGVSKNNSSQYFIAVMTTTNAKKYRVYIYTEDIGGSKLIKEFRVMSE